MKKKDCVVQAQLWRCIMSLETKESSTSCIVIRAKGTILHFTPIEFALVTGLNCVTNRDDFVFDEERPNRIIDQYFDGESFIQKKELLAAISDKIWGNDNDEEALKFANLYFIHAFLLSSVDIVAIPRLHFDLIESDRYSDYPWGSVAFEELARSLHKKLKPKGNFYMILGMPLAIQIWLYECCSNVLPSFTSKEKLKPHPKGVDEQTPNRTPPPRAAKMPSVRTPIHKPIQTKTMIRANRKDINRPDSKQTILVPSPTSSSFSSEDENVVVSKKAFDKFRDKVWKEFNDMRGLLSSSTKNQAKDIESDQPPTDENVNNTSSHQATPKFDHEFNKNLEGTVVAKEMTGNQSNSMNDVYNDIDEYNEDNDDVLNTKLVDGSIAEAQVSESQFTFPDFQMMSLEALILTS
ncbi:hypothetical protein FXO37_28634 [Capsicum annuum]|nr:hypothetical protein FXO37_28634 [Capsicum annuum]